MSAVGGADDARNGRATAPVIVAPPEDGPGREGVPGMAVDMDEVMQFAGRAVGDVDEIRH